MWKFDSMTTDTDAPVNCVQKKAEDPSMEAPSKEKVVPDGGFWSDKGRTGPVKPEDVLAELQRMHPEMTMITNEDGVLCIGLKDFYMATCGIEDATARRRVADLLKNQPKVYQEIVSKIANKKGGCHSTHFLFFSM